MKTIIAGTRNVYDYGIILRAVKKSGFFISEVVSGGCRGVDLMGEMFAERNKIPIKVFRAQWEVFGKVAGPIRNSEMAQHADALIAIWDGKSRGTKDMITKMRAIDKPVCIYTASHPTAGRPHYKCSGGK